MWPWCGRAVNDRKTHFLSIELLQQYVSSWNCGLFFHLRCRRKLSKNAIWIGIFTLVFYKMKKKKKSYMIVTHSNWKLSENCCASNITLQTWKSNAKKMHLHLYYNQYAALPWYSAGAIITFIQHCLKNSITWHKKLWYSVHLLPFASVILSPTLFSANICLTLEAVIIAGSVKENSCCNLLFLSVVIVKK